MHSAPIKLTPSCTRATELQVEPDESCHRALPPPQASLTPQHAQKMRRGEIIRDLAITASLSRSGAIKLQGGVHCVAFHLDLLVSCSTSRLALIRGQN